MIDLHAASARVSHALLPASASTGSAAASTTTSTTADTTGTNVSSNDFLTLLVTEMKNQDPTQPTDPNAYIQQLVGVNSLQQLIAINKDLSAVTTSTSGTQTNPITQS